LPWPATGSASLLIISTCARISETSGASVTPTCLLRPPLALAELLWDQEAVRPLYYRPGRRRPTPPGFRLPARSACRDPRRTVVASAPPADSPVQPSLDARSASGSCRARL